MEVMRGELGEVVDARCWAELETLCSPQSDM